MIPAVVYHGTTQRFRKFDMRKAFRDAFLGPAIYTTDSEDDALELYANENSPDLQSRIQFLADDYYNDGDRVVTWAQAAKKARRELCGKQHRLLHIRPVVKNTAVVSKYRDNRETVINLWSYDPADPEELIESSEMVTIYNFLSRYIDSENITFCDAEITIRELFRLIDDNIQWEPPDDNNPGEVKQGLLKALGYDSLLMLDVGNYFQIYNSRGIVANHLIIFSPDSVKIVKRQKLT